MHALILMSPPSFTEKSLAAFTAHLQTLQQAAEVHVQGKLIAGVNSKVQLFKWIQTDDGSRELQIECSHTGHVLALYVVTRGDFVIVGERKSSSSSRVLEPLHSGREQY